MDHFHIVPGTIRPDKCATGAVRHLGGDFRKQRRQFLICRQISARHHAGAFQRPFFAAGHAGANKTDPFGGQRRVATPGIFKERVAAIDDDIPGFQIRQYLFDHVIHRFAGFDHQHHPAGLLQGSGQLRQRVRPLDRQSGGIPGQKFVDPGCSPVKHTNLKPFVHHVEYQVFPHHGQSDQSDIT